MDGEIKHQRISEMTKCCLCLQEKKLCNSHIIPEFMFKSLYDPDNHRFYPLTDDPETPKHFKKGFRERLLCEDCEQKMSEWERYFHQLLVKRITFVGKKPGIVAVANGLDYAKVKLFQMSLIWRAGISSTRKEFQNVQLGPHEERLRHMLNKGDPGEPYDYGCILLLTPSYADLLSGLMMLANESRFDGHRCYSFLLCGVTWIFLVSKHTKSFHTTELFLSRDGKLSIIIDDKYSKQMFERTVTDWKNKGILDKCKPMI